VIAEGSGKLLPEAFIAYFSGGRPLYPMLTAPLDDKYFGFAVQEARVSYACVWFGHWTDLGRSGCGAVRRLFGADILTERNARALRDRVFDIEPVRAALSTSWIVPPAHLREANDPIGDPIFDDRDMSRRPQTARSRLQVHRLEAHDPP
jgi:hypothetical protein